MVHPPGEVERSLAHHRSEIVVVEQQANLAVRCDEGVNVARLDCRGPNDRVRDDHILQLVQQGVRPSILAPLPALLERHQHGRFFVLPDIELIGAGTDGLHAQILKRRCFHVGGRGHHAAALLQVRQQCRVGTRQGEFQRAGVEHILRLDHRERRRVHAAARNVRIDGAIEVESGRFGVEVRAIVELHPLAGREHDRDVIDSFEGFRQRCIEVDDAVPHASQSEGRKSRARGRIGSNAVDGSMPL